MQRDLDALTRETFDLLIVGGGITGAGVAFDAASRGWRVALIDQADFASGTSSVSSKLIHGGLRYLEHGHLPLVHEALRERAWLLWAAPHLVRPLRFVLPFYQGDRVPPWQWRVGLTIYDLLAGAAKIRRSRPLTLSALRHELPQLRCVGLRGGAAYFDAQMDDARLCLEVLHTAVAYGARIANYVAAITFEKDGERITGVSARDQLSGQEGLITARVVLNATGPWVDNVCRLAGDECDPHLAPTKGIHLVLPDRRLTSALLLLHPRDGRVFFVIPWLGKTLVGTTDTIATEGPDDLTVQPDDVAYLLEGWRHFFPEDTEPPILGTFAGLRPLIRAKPGEPSARSREFRIFTSPSGLVSVAGGKYTTFRSMSEQITDVLAQRLNRRERCRTSKLKLTSSPAQTWSDFLEQTSARLVTQCGITLPQALRLTERYGNRIDEVTSYLASPAAREPIAPGEPELRGELTYQRDHEMAVTVADSLLRRTRLGLYVPSVRQNTVW